MKHLVQFSTGAASAEVAYRAFEEHGPDRVALLTADTRVEDEDNWRFAFEVVADLQALYGAIEWQVVADGRTPMQVGRDHRAIPNTRWPICSRVLKIELMRAYLERHYEPGEVVLDLGLDWTEEDRIEGRMERGVWRPGTRERWAPWATGYPLIDRPQLTKPQVLDLFRERGIAPPRLYDLGFGHANCGGACVRGGQTEWRRLLFWHRDRYLEWEAEEETSREQLGDYSILRDRTGGTTVPLPLRRFRERLEVTPSLFDPDDVGACGCTT